MLNILYYLYNNAQYNSQEDITGMAEDLLSKAKNDQNFKNQVAKNLQRYNYLQQASAHHEITKIPEGMLKKVQGNREIYFYFGYMQPTLKKDMGQVAIYLVKNFKPNPKKPYKFVFFNQECSDNYVLWNFRQIFGSLKLEQIAALEQLIVVKPYFYHKSMDWMTFGTIPKFIRSRTKFVSSSHELCQHLKCSINILAENVPSHLYEKQLSYINQKDLPQFDLQNLRNNFKGHERSDQQNFVMKQFQNSIKSMIMKPGYQINNLQDYEIGAQGVPIILKMLIFYFDKQNHQQGLQEQGIFRKSVSIDQQNQTILQILSKNYDYLLDVKNPHIIANLIKRFCSSLKNPIISFSKFKQLMNDQGIKNKAEHLKKVFEELPSLNKRVLLFLFTFFKQKILPLQHKNKMNANNIAICLSPCIMRSQVPSAADLIYATKSVAYCKLFLSEFDEIFGEKQKRLQLYRSSYLQNKKNFNQNLDLGLSLAMEITQNNLLENAKLQQLQINNRNSRKYQQTNQQWSIEQDCTLNKDLTQKLIDKQQNKQQNYALINNQTVAKQQNKEPDCALNKQLAHEVDDNDKQQNKQQNCAINKDTTEQIVDNQQNNETQNNLDI